MKKINSISLFYLMMFSFALVVSIRNLPTIAASGMQMVFFGLVTAIFFFIPTALVSAELATGWPQMGGVAVWVKEAFGKRLGFFAVWLQWTYMICSVISMLYFICATLAFVFNESLAVNKTYLIISELIFIWIFTFLNLKGMHVSKIVSTIGFLLGVLFPALVIIVLSIFYIFSNYPIELNLSLTTSNFLPNFKEISTLVLLIGVIRAFAGIEVSAAHANDVENPQRSFPIAIFTVVVLGLLLTILGALSVGIVIDKKDLSLSAGVMDAFKIFFKKFNFNFVGLIPIIAILVAAGQIGSFSSWLISPIKGILKMGNEGELPLFFHKVNKNNVPTNLMIIQAIIISIIGTFFLLFTKSINVAFWISVALSMIIYSSMYFLMFLAAIFLRYKKPNVKRKFKVWGKNVGMWIICIIGMLTMLASFILGFIPPAEFTPQKIKSYKAILIIAIAIVFISPFIITAFKKPSWQNNKKLD